MPFVMRSSIKTPIYASFLFRNLIPYNMTSHHQDSETPGHRTNFRILSGFSLQLYKCTQKSIMLQGALAATSLFFKLTCVSSNSNKNVRGIKLPGGLDAPFLINTNIKPHGSISNPCSCCCVFLLRPEKHHKDPSSW